jgi:hypothetical protein
MTVATVGLKEMALLNLLYTIRTTSGLVLSSSSAMSEACEHEQEIMLMLLMMMIYAVRSVAPSMQAEHAHPPYLSNWVWTHHHLPIIIIQMFVVFAIS